MIITKLHQCVYNAIVSLCLKYKNKGEQMYYNTTREEGVQLKLNIEKAHNQKHKVLSVFQKNPTQNYCADDIIRVLTERDEINTNTPLTSIRRAITDLTNDDYIVKTDKRVMGSAGRKTYTWRLK